MSQTRRSYPSDLTDQQWELIKEMIPIARSGGRPRTTEVRFVVNAILYLTRTGCAWRYLPNEYPPYKTVYDYFSKWKSQGIWRKIHLALVTKIRVAEGKKEDPSMVIIDAQSVRAQYGEERGWDGFKKVQGRKREILVDTLGLLWAVKVHAANQGENKRGFDAVERYPAKTKPQKILGDHSYSKSPFDGLVYGKWKIWPETLRAKRVATKEIKYFRPVKKISVSNLKPKRWIVERTFAWFNHSRRLSRDYEKKICNSEALLYISQIPMMLNRLAFQPP
jgi:putative transposase